MSVPAALRSLRWTARCSGVVPSGSTALDATLPVARCARIVPPLADSAAAIDTQVKYFRDIINAPTAAAAPAAR
jgi:hypothetical protein